MIQEAAQVSASELIVHFSELGGDPSYVAALAFLAHKLIAAKKPNARCVLSLLKLMHAVLPDDTEEARNVRQSPEWAALHLQAAPAMKAHGATKTVRWFMVLVPRFLTPHVW